MKRVWQGSNRLRVVVKPKYCCRVEGESLISASTRQAKRLQLISSTEQKEIILWRFYISNGSCLLGDEKIRYKWNLIFSRQCFQGFHFITLIASTNCSRRKRKFLVWDNLSKVYEVLGVLWLYKVQGLWWLNKKDWRICCRFVIFSPVWGDSDSCIIYI